MPKSLESSPSGHLKLLDSQLAQRLHDGCASTLADHSENLAQLFGLRWQGYMALANRIFFDTPSGTALKVLQTGLTRKLDCKSDGSFDLFLCLLAKTLEGSEQSCQIVYYGIDIDQEAVHFSRSLVTHFFPNGSQHLTAHYSCSDSILALQNILTTEKQAGFDFVYLDSYDCDYEWQGPSQQHQLREAELSHELLKPEGLMLLDDIHLKQFGKGGLSIPYLVRTGYEFLMLGYQALFRKPEQTTEPKVISEIEQGRILDGVRQYYIGKNYFESLKLCLILLAYDCQLESFRYLMGANLAELGRRTEAARYVQQELRFFPENGEARELAKTLGDAGFGEEL